MASARVVLLNSIKIVQKSRFSTKLTELKMYIYLPLAKGYLH